MFEYHNSTSSSIMSIRQMYQNEVIILDRGAYTTCAVNLYGALITSWRIQNKEHIFLSRQSKLYYMSRARGGIGVAFPKYGKWEFGKMHGFARDLKWSVEMPPKRMENGDICAVFSLQNDEYTKSLWAYKFKLLYKITLKEMELVTHFTVINTCQHFTMEFEIVQHCLFKVSDVAKCKVVGLKDCSLVDRVEACQKAYPKEDREEVDVLTKTDRLYKDTPDVIYITNGEGEEVIKITKSNLPDFNLWNPWIEQAKELRDLGDDEYQYFLSTDCGVIAKQISLGPNCSWSSMITYEIIEPQEEEAIVGHFYDYFDSYC
ncbi:unnamed protein product [Phaedon cochleariae]|uniref:glucose-6-phosphate 1-epimerase n=1 Tax=Phaedon cochleariae TaxID=80249 RepID=A0A9P0DHB8_PHACE|nr:unnamed protein product [Phaedon cochleariae]